VLGAARHAVGILLNEGKIAGVDANPQQAVVWWRRCVDDHRHIQATYELATACYLGEGMPEYPEWAVRLFWRAAHLGHAGAAYMLGECMLNGVGIERDRANALEWLVTAAELGHRGARDRVLTVLNEDYSNLDAGQAAEERKQEEAVKWMNLHDEAKLKAVNIERRYTIGGGSRNPAVRARRKTIVAESRDEL
jgi:TPR repeat protein